MFKNEAIREEDFERYGLEAVAKKYRTINGVGWLEWTIDRDRDMYLKKLSNGREEEDGIDKWIFVWRGKVAYFIESVKATGGGLGGDGWVDRDISYISIDGAMLSVRREMETAIKEAFEVYGGAGLYSRHKISLRNIQFN